MITNLSKRKNLAKKAVFLRSVAARAKGLMFHPKLKDEGYIFVFDKLRSISFHMCFVFFPIDMLFLGEDKEVLNIRRNVKPFTLHIRSKAKYVIELHSNSTTDVKLGDIISFK